MDTKLVTKQIRLNEWADIIKSCKSSGMKVYEYLEQHGISRDSYYYRLKKVKEAALSQAGLQIPDQLSFDMKTGEILNEAEKLVEHGIPAETDYEEVIVKRKKVKGKRDINLENLDVEIINHERSKEDLENEFPNGWNCLPDYIYKELKYIPAKFKVLEYHVKVYAGKREGDGILRAEAPNRLLPHSFLTPELAAAIFNAKYVNAVPLNRLSEEFLRNDINIPRQDMAGWMIRIYSYYLKPIHARYKKEVLNSHHVHCDETPFIMPKNGKEYMWVFHSPGDNDTHPIFLYEYLGGRNGKVIQEYLSGYKGYLITDGYQPYHTLDKTSYEYFVHMLTELVKHPRNDVPEEVIEALMPWSDKLPDEVRKTKTR